MPSWIGLVKRLDHSVCSHNSELLGDGVKPDYVAVTAPDALQECGTKRRRKESLGHSLVIEVGSRSWKIIAVTFEVVRAAAEAGETVWLDGHDAFVGIPPLSERRNLAQPRLK